MSKKHVRPTLRLMVCMTLNCVDLTQFSVIWIIYRNAGLTCFSIYLNVLYHHQFFFFLCISHGSVDAIMVWWNM